ncbi:MAG: FtsW/RodA/SpoVE family cell cycle protein [Candidatus Krumholzibacteriota bacterium]|nr:FtsW/RodA/SpoVE family cell cycle protein [Candidatus Krumholzibacteriota bacterium]
MNALGTLDRTLLALTFLTVLAGMVVLGSAVASGGWELSGPGHGSAYLLRRLTQLAVGLALMLALALTDHRWLRRLSPAAGLLGIALLVAVLFTASVRGTRGWIGGFQAVDVARVGLLMLLAERLAARAADSRAWRRFALPLAALVLATGLVALQPDYGSALALGFCGGAVLVAAAPPRRWLLAGLLALVVVGAAGYRFSDRIQHRVDLTYHAGGMEDTGETYQLRQSLIGLGAGGLWGQGAARSRQKSFLPDHHTDFILAIAGEEFGLLGTLTLLGLLTALSLRALILAARQADPFACYLAAGVGATIFVYTTLNMAVALGLFPLTGVPLPFVSHGGSSLVMHLGALGLVLSVTRSRRGGRPARRRAEGRENILMEDLFGGRGR